MTRFDEDHSVWVQKGATLSQISAQKEYGLTYEEIAAAANKKKLRWQVRYAHGNPYFLLVRSEVKALALKLHGRSQVNLQLRNRDLKKAKSELRKVTKLARQLQKVIAAIENGTWDGSETIPCVPPPPPPPLRRCWVRRS